MKLLNIETPVTKNFIPQILLNVQDFYFHKVGYTSYDEGIFGPLTEHTSLHRRYKIRYHIACTPNYSSESSSPIKAVGHSIGLV
jgi:hypothetical protein